MTPIRSTPITKHRLARLIAWALAMLAWIGAMLFADTSARPNRRHIRRRYSQLSLQPMARMVARLIFLRATQLIPMPALRRRSIRVSAAPGFRKRVQPRQLVRSAIGAAVRKSLRHRDLRTRLAILLNALANIDALAAKLTRRLRRRFTRLAALTVACPPHDSVRWIAMPAPAFADSS